MTDTSKTPSNSRSDRPLRAPRSGRPRRAVKRSDARLAAVQALYQMDANVIPVATVLDEFIRFRFDDQRPDAEAGTAGDVDRQLFVDIVRGASAQRDTLDDIIESALAAGWSLARMDRVLLAILRAGAFELHTRDKTPARVAISEYVDVAHAFFEGKEPGFVNGVMDRLARALRAEELSVARPGDDTATGGD